MGPIKINYLRGREVRTKKLDLAPEDKRSREEEIWFWGESDGWTPRERLGAAPGTLPVPSI